MIEKEEFFKRLTENKYSPDIKETIEYKLPVIKYYLKHCNSNNAILNQLAVTLNSISIKDVTNDDDFRLMNIAFDSLIDKHKIYGQHVLTLEGYSR